MIFKSTKLGKQRVFFSLLLLNMDTNDVCVVVVVVVGLYVNN